MKRFVKRLKDITKRTINLLLNRTSGILDIRSVETIMDEELEKHLQPGKKTILYIAKRYDYGKKDWGLSFEHYNFYNALLRAGYSLVYFDYDRIKQKYGNKKMSQILREAVFYYHPEILLYLHTNDWVDHSLWKEISNELPTKTVIFLLDDNMQYENTRSIWELFNLVVTTDKNGYEKRKKEGFNKVFLSQYACNPFIYKNLNLPRIYDVTFIGRCYGERREFVNKLKEKGIDIKTFGQG